MALLLFTLHSHHHYSTTPETCESESESGRPLRLPIQASHWKPHTILGLGLLVLFLGQLGFVVGRLRFDNNWKESR